MRLSRRFCSAVEGLVKVTRNTDSGVAVVSLNCPSRLNAMTVEMGEQFEATMHGLRDEIVMKPDALSTPRCVVITGEGRAFSAGGDLAMLVERSKTPAKQNSLIMRRFYERFLSVRAVPVPTIAAINGHAIGAGCALTLACDFRICHPKAKLGLTFTDLGLHPGMGSSHFLPLLIGHERANRMLLLSEVITGEDAERIGLVGELSSDPLSTALDMAARLASKPPAAVQTTVRSTRFKHESELERALFREADSQAVCFSSQEYKDALVGMQAAITAKKAAKSSL